jgi:hypothetical protein
MTDQNKIGDCSQCGHIEWQYRIDRGECRICLLFSNEKERTI